MLAARQQIGMTEKQNAKKKPFINDTEIANWKKSKRKLEKTYKKISQGHTLNNKHINKINTIMKEYSIPEITNNNTTENKLTNINNTISKIRNLINHKIRKMERKNINSKVISILQAIKENKHKVFKLTNKKRNTTKIQAVQEKNKIYTEPEEVKLKTSEYWKNIFNEKITIKNTQQTLQTNTT
jgi:hypothetical protein